MNSKVINGNRPETVYVVGRNAESSSTINAGTPVALVINGTDDGLAVVLPATATATKAHSLCYGVAVQSAVAGAQIQVQVYGFCNTVNLVRGTRSDTNAAWPSRAALAVGNALGIDTVNNAFTVTPDLVTVAGTLATGASSDTVTVDWGLLRYFKPVVLCSSQASTTTATSATTYATGTVSTMAVKAFLRLM